MYNIIKIGSALGESLTSDQVDNVINKISTFYDYECYKTGFTPSKITDKKLEALEKMSQNKKIHCFWHQEDDFQLTSKNYIWTYPNKPLGRHSVCVLPENPRQISGVAGICLDDFSNFKREKDEQG